MSSNGGAARQWDCAIALAIARHLAFHLLRVLLRAADHREQSTVDLVRQASAPQVSGDLGQAQTGPPAITSAGFLFLLDPQGHKKQDLFKSGASNKNQQHTWFVNLKQPGP